MKYHMWILAIVMIVTLVYSDKGCGNRNIKKKIIEFITLVMSLFLGVRTWWMADLTKYHTQYLSCGGDDWREVVFGDFENMGLRLFFRLEYVLTDGNYQIALIIIAFFCMSCLGFVIYKYSVSPYWSYVMYITMGFYFFTFSGLKQSIAMAFLLLAFSGIIEQKLGYYIVMVLAAAFFHSPALIFLPAYVLVRKRIDKTYWLYLATLFAIFFLFQNKLVSFLSEMYYEEDLTLGVDGTVGGRFLMMLVMLVCGIIFRPPSEKDYVYNRVFNVTVFATLLQSFAMFGNEFSRLADYYFQFVILYVPFIFEYRQGRERHQLSMNAESAALQFNWKSYQLIYFGVTVFSIWYFYNYIKGDISGILDYKFFWEVAETTWGS